MSYAGSAVNALRGVREYMPVIFQGRGIDVPSTVRQYTLCRNQSRVGLRADASLMRIDAQHYQYCPKRPIDIAFDFLVFLVVP